MANVYDFRMLVSNENLKLNLEKLMSPDKETLTLRNLIAKTNQIENDSDFLKVQQDYTVECYWGVEPLLNKSVKDPTLHQILDGMKLQGVISYVLETLKEYRNLSYKLIPEGYAIICQLLYSFPNNTSYSITIELILSLNDQGKFGDPDKDVALFVHIADRKLKGEYPFKNSDYESLFLKGFHMHLVESLNTKYAFFKPEYQLDFPNDFEMNGFDLEYFNVLKPWKRFSNIYPFDTVMVFGEELVKELELDKVKWGNEHIYYIKQLQNNILWLNSPRELEASSHYQIPDEKYRYDIKHYESLEKILPNSVLEFGDVRKLVIDFNGNFHYEEMNFDFEHLKGFIFR